MIKTPIPDSYWVERGKFLAGEYPGAESEDEARRKLRAFLDAKISYFIDLTEEHENLAPYADLLRNEAEKLGRKVVHHRMPIRDVSVPTDEFMDEIQEVISDAIEEGHAVYVHCWGGVGRTGTVVGCYLVEQGMSGEEAIEELARLRAGTPKASRKSPETDEQEAMIQVWEMEQGDEDDDSEWEDRNKSLEELLKLISGIEGMMVKALSGAVVAVPMVEGDDDDDQSFAGFIIGEEKKTVFLAFTSMEEVAAYFEDEPTPVAILDAAGFIKMLVETDSMESNFDGLIINPASDLHHFIPVEALKYIAAELPDDDE